MLVDINSNIADLKILDQKLAISITLKIITVFNMNGFKNVQRDQFVDQMKFKKEENENKF